MIKFFRNIRKRLLDENKTGKYVKYAVGEIFLVVIGILIALQINTWNENRKARGIEIETLKELRSDLKQSLFDIEGDQQYFRFSKRNTEHILENFKNKGSNRDSLNFYFAQMYPFSTFSINSTTFDNLRQSGTNAVANDSIRVKLSDFYTHSINLYKEYEQRLVVAHDQDYITPMKMSEFRTYSRDSLVLKNYDSFFDNSFHQQVLNKSIFIFENIIGYQTLLIKDLKELIGQIDKEVDF